VSECTCHIITGLVEGVLESRCESSNHVLLQDLSRSAPKQLLKWDMGGETVCQTSRLLQWDEVSWWAVTELVLTLHYIPVPLEGHFCSMLCMRYWATVFFKYLILRQVLLHLPPFTSYLPPGIPCTRFRCTIWEAICRWSWNSHV